MDYSKVLVLCDDLEDVRLESEQADFEKRNLSSKLLKKLLVLVGDIDYGAPLPPERLVCMARIILVAAGHSGPHYWTSHDTRELADGQQSDRLSDSMIICVIYRDPWQFM